MKKPKIDYQVGAFGPAVVFMSYSKFHDQTGNNKKGFTFWKHNKTEHINTYIEKHQFGLTRSRDKIGLFHD